jgi:hypothetical protein
MAAAGNIIILKMVGNRVSLDPILKKGGNRVSPDPRWRLCKRTDGGPPAKMAAMRNIIILKWWEMVSLGGCVKEQMVGPCLRWLPWAM